MSENVLKTTDSTTESLNSTTEKSSEIPFGASEKTKMSRKERNHAYYLRRKNLNSTTEKPTEIEASRVERLSKSAGITSTESPAASPSPKPKDKKWIYILIVIAVLGALAAFYLFSRKSGANSNSGSDGLRTW